jgi:hypothetical protein
MNRLTKGQDGDREFFFYSHFEELQLPILKLVKFLEDMHKRPPRKSKVGDYLFQLAEYHADAPRDCHLLNQNNLVRHYGIILDFDNGSVSPDEFVRIFWHEAGSRTKVAFIICNTHSASPGTPNKFRVILPYNGSADTIAEHQAIFDSIVKRLAEEGHSPKSSGLDHASRNPVQRYYLPCTNAAHQGSAFFKAYGLRRTDEFLRYAIRPGTYAALAVPEDLPIYMVSPEHEGISPTQVRARENADRLMAEIEDMTEGRRKPVFELVTELVRSGEALREIEDVLLSWAPDEQVEHHVRGAVDSWRKHKRDGGPSRDSVSGPTPGSSAPMRRLPIKVHRPSAA